MTKPTIPLQPEWIREKVDEILVSENVKKIFANLSEQESSKALEDVRNRLGKRFEVIKDSRSLELLEQRARDVFRLNLLTIEQHQNVLRQEAEIRRIENNPSLVKSSEFMTEERKRIPLRNQPNMEGYNNSEGFPNDVGNNFHSFYGGSDEEINAILNRTTPIVHADLPSKSYRNNVIDSRRLTQENLKYSAKALEVLLNEGRDMQDRDLKSLKLRNESLNKVSNAGEFLGNAFYDSVVKPFTRGIVYDSVAEEGSFYKRNQRERLKYLSDAKTKIGVNSLDGAMFLRYLEGVAQSLKNSQNPEDIELYNALAPWIENQIKEVTKKIEEFKAKELDQKIDDSNKNFLEKSQQFIKAEDDAFKWQLLCAITLIAPFAPAVAGLGPIFNVITPVFDIFGPVLFGSQGVATAIGNLSTAIPGFGHLAQVIRFDYAVEWLLNNTPIVNSVLGNEGLVNLITRSDIMQNFVAGAIEPMTESPFFLLAPALMGATYRASSDLDHYFKKFKYSDDERKAFKGLIDSYTKGREKFIGNIIKGDEKVPSIAAQIMALRKNAAIDSAFKTLILGMSEEELKQFDKYKIEVPDQNDPTKKISKTLSELQRDCELDYSLITKYVMNSPEITQLRKDISAYSVASEKNSDTKFEQLSPKQIDDFSKEFEFNKSMLAIHREAENRGMEVPSYGNMEEMLSNLKALEKKIIDSDTQKFQTITNSLAPDVKFSPKEYSQPFARANSQALI